MTRTHLVAMTIVALGYAASASAQSADVQYAREPQVHVDPLDPLDDLAVRVTGRTITPSVPSVYRSVPVAASYDTTMQYYSQEPANDARYEEESQTRSAKPGWLSAMQGISASMQLSHEAIGVYEHALEAKSLSQIVNGR